MVNIHCTLYKGYINFIIDNTKSETHKTHNAFWYSFVSLVRKYTIQNSQNWVFKISADHLIRQHSALSIQCIWKSNNVWNIGLFIVIFAQNHVSHHLEQCIVHFLKTSIRISGWLRLGFCISFFILHFLAETKTIFNFPLALVSSAWFVQLYQFMII